MQERSLCEVLLYDCFLTTDEELVSLAGQMSQTIQKAPFGWVILQRFLIQAEDVQELFFSPVM